MLEIKYIGQKLQKSYVGKAGAKKEFGIFQTMLFRENSEELEPQIRKNWSRPILILPGRSTKRGHFFQNSIAPTKKLHGASTFDI